MIAGTSMQREAARAGQQDAPETYESLRSRTDTRRVPLTGSV